MARWLIERGNDGLSSAGSTGEGQALDESERTALWAAVKDAVGDRATVIANAGTDNTRDSIAAAQDAAAAGADAILAVVPYYNKPTQSGMLAHFGAIAESTGLPVFIYNIPGRTGVNMLPETLLQLAHDHANIAGVKESSGDLKQIATILRSRPSTFTGLGGRRSSLPSVLGRRRRRRRRRGDPPLLARVPAHVRRISRRPRRRGGAKFTPRLLPLFDALFATTNPIPIKWAMKQPGFHAGACRLPLDGMPASLANRLRPLLAPFLVARIRGAGRALVAALEILGCRLDLVAADDATSRILQFAREGSGAQVVTLGTEMVVAAHKDARFRAVRQRLRALALRHRRSARRSAPAGSELASARYRCRADRGRLRARGARGDLQVYFLGGAPGVAADAAAILESRFPGLPVAGMRMAISTTIAAPKSQRRSGRAARNCSSSDWVRRGRSSGSPNTCARRAAAPASASAARSTSSAAEWRARRRSIGGSGLEWLYRLVREPRRWRRQLALPQFVWLVALEGLGVGRKRAANT